MGAYCFHLRFSVGFVFLNLQFLVEYFVERFTFVAFLVAILLSVLLRYTASYYSFSIVEVLFYLHYNDDVREWFFLIYFFNITKLRLSRHEPLIEQKMLAHLGYLFSLLGFCCFVLLCVIELLLKSASVSILHSKISLKLGLLHVFGDRRIMKRLSMFYLQISTYMDMLKINLNQTKYLANTSSFRILAKPAS